MSIKVEGIELEIKDKASRAADGAVKLETALKNLKATVKGGLGLSSATEGLSELDKVLANLHLDKLKELTKGLEKLKGISVKGAAAPASGAAAATKSVSGESVSGTAEAIKKAEPDTSNYAKFEQTLKRVKVEAKATTSRLEKLGAAIKRVFVYRMIRAAIKEVTKAFQEGIQNAYQYSKAISGPLAKNMDALATSALFLKNGLGAAMAPIINALTPIVTRLADAVANLGNSIAGFFAMITGQSTYIKAIKYATEYADATEGAAKAQKQLLGFDELNVLTDKGGSGGSSLDYSKMFETVDTSTFKKTFEGLPKVISEKLKEAFNTIADLIQNVNWFEIPAKIAEKLKSAFDNFDFKGVFQSFGKLLGSLFVASISLPAGLLKELFLSHITKELSGLDADASIFEKAFAIAKGIVKGLLSGLGDLAGWGYENIVKPLFRGIKDGIFGTILKQLPLEVRWEVATKWAEFKHWFKDNILNIFTAQHWQDVFSSIWAGFDTVIGWIKAKWEGLKRWLKDNPIKTLFNKQDSMAIGGFGGSISFTPLAEGGYPAAGSMFVAGEAGPELVSQVGNRTGVINNDQFGSIVATAAENIINAILASGQATAEAAREGGNVYLDKTLVSRALYGSMQSEGTRKGGSAVQFVGV